MSVAPCDARDDARELELDELPTARRRGRRARWDLAQSRGNKLKLRRR